MLNPVYDLLPRMGWVTQSAICQKWSDFSYDAVSDTICCPSPNYCWCTARAPRPTTAGAPPVPSAQLLLVHRPCPVPMTQDPRLILCTHRCWTGPELAPCLTSILT